ncbi:epoxide hydrolase family protein [Streptomyces chartreusis]|uniref:epoxide hydrolase family protein n=1 Tax=Streptomyces chartreusis TaxID=1969 RepID=UPI002F909891|nr:epoxide hydrolase [Streptomyces chartreusis]WTA33529.1 epoxide hydrolase [Streptomyces chartreusis]
MQIRPHVIAIADEQLQDLDRRLQHTRWPDALPGMDWEDGTDLAFLQRLTDYWRTGFDWRRQEARLNALPQFVAELDELDIHFIHARGTGENPLPLVITHGWPGSGFDLARIIPLLADPGSHGADPADSFDVVVPSLPGYGFSQRPDRAGVGPRETADLWQRLMHGLGYQHFGVQAGDWGAAVSMWLAQRHPADVAGLHLNFIPGSFRPPLGDGAPELTAEEEQFLRDASQWFDAEGGYHRLQSTRPQTPAYALTDSPAGLAAWIIEKMRGWSDCGGDVERVFSLDAILTNVSLYWFTATIGSSMRFYRENRLTPQQFGAGERVHPPLGVAAFPQDLMPPRSWIERVFDVAQWTQMPRGGHFGAMEHPKLLAEEIRTFFRPLRSAAGSVRPQSGGGS